MKFTCLILVLLSLLTGCAAMQEYNRSLEKDAVAERNSNADQIQTVPAMSATDLMNFHSVGKFESNYCDADAECLHSLKLKAFAQHADVVVVGEKITHEKCDYIKDAKGHAVIDKTKGITFTSCFSIRGEGYKRNQ